MSARMFSVELLCVSFHSMSVPLGSREFLLSFLAVQGSPGTRTACCPTKRVMAWTRRLCAGEPSNSLSAMLLLFARPSDGDLRRKAAPVAGTPIVSRRRAVSLLSGRHPLCRTSRHPFARGSVAILHPGRYPVSLGIQAGFPTKYMPQVVA
jgi:hypothetical protein